MRSRDGAAPRRRQLAPAPRMAAPHHHDERALEQRCRGETLAWTIHAPDRQIEIAAIQPVNDVQGSARPQIEPYGDKNAIQGCACRRREKRRSHRRRRAGGFDPAQFPLLPHRPHVRSLPMALCPCCRAGPGQCRLALALARAQHWLSTRTPSRRQVAAVSRASCSREADLRTSEGLACIL
jgi:hypothetical protein